MTTPSLVVLPEQAWQAIQAELAALRDLVQTALSQQSGAPVLALSIEEACKSLRLGKSSLTVLMQSGELPSLDVCGRRLITVDDAKEFLRRKTAEPYKPRPARTKRQSQGRVA